MGTAWDTGTLIGTRLGSCTLERLLGVGGMSAVYLAQQDHPHRQVAVKVVHPPATASPEERARFLARCQREADVAASLDHPNIVPVYEFGEDGDIAYLVMPYLADGSLADLLARQGPLPVERVADYVEQAALALDYAHAHGIVHRDVKPSNLLLHPDGRLLLADFGVAHKADDPADDAVARLPDTVWGTPEFMAPEQIAGEQITAATDIYSLGIVAYTLLTGHPPFVGESTEDILRWQLQGPPPSLRAVRPDLPPRVEEAVLQALAEQAADRYASASSFAQALKAAAGESAASAAEPQRPWDRLAASVQPVAYTITRLIFRNDAATIPDAATPPEGGRGPTWPAARAPAASESDAHTGYPRRRAASRAPDASLILVPVLIAILVFLLAVTRGFTGSTMAPVGGEPANSTPVAASETSSSDSVALTWLSVSPDHVDLDCSTNRAAQITLRNRGPEAMLWRTDIAFLDGISVSPDFGSLESGASVTVVVTNTSRVFAHNNTLTFKPLISKAGRPVVVTYTTTPCWLG